ncbi:MAG: response regulator [Clostridiales bacterium]|jgi:two-component system chemotaxis response regulator CheY|nr:response regulator [Clostridiales bacterium]
MGKKILIVDDATFMRMMIRDILVANGYEIAGEAENGIQAVSMFKRTAPDLVLMDITMPEMDGIRAVKEIMKADQTARIVMVSAMGQQAMVIQSIQSGALDFVVKPFQPDRVVDAIDKALAAAVRPGL